MPRLLSVPFFSADARVEDPTCSGASGAGCREGGLIEQAPGYMARQDRTEIHALLFQGDGLLLRRPVPAHRQHPLQQVGPRIPESRPELEVARSSAFHPISL